MNAVVMKNITKQFPGVLANDSVNLEVREGEILSLVGENGAGKSTLMNILYGLYVPDEGEIYINEQKVQYTSTIGAIEHGIGMVHQHFMLIPRLSIAENIVLGYEPGNFLKFDRKKAVELVTPLLESFGIEINPNLPISAISLGMQQKVEIVKALYRNAKILILDEPTAVLSPQEIDELGVLLGELKRKGLSIIIITHKLQEVKNFSDRITVMRRGRNVGSVVTKDTSIDEIIEMMVGRTVEAVGKKRKEMEHQEVLFQISHLNYVKHGTHILKDINLEVRRGEILGIAGIDGSGQDELTEIINGNLRQTSGDILFKKELINQKTPKERRDSAMGFIPQDRHKNGLVLDFSIEENLVLGYERSSRYNQSGFIDTKSRKKDAREKIQKFDVRTPSELTSARSLSGGNQQKIIIAREMSEEPDFIVVNQPTRGVDIGAIEFIHGILVEARNQGKAVLIVSLELDELLDLCDRIIVMYSGEIAGEMDIKDASREKIGFLMVGEKHG